MIDKSFVSGRNRVRLKGIVCQRERGPLVLALAVGGRRLGEVVLLKGRQLVEERIGGNGLNRGRMCPRFQSGVGEPETEMLQNSPDHRGILDGGNDPHGMLASGAHQGIRLIDLGRIKRDQFRLISLEQRSSSKRVGTPSSASRFRSLPRVEFA